MQHKYTVWDTSFINKKKFMPQQATDEEEMLSNNNSLQANKVETTSGNGEK